MAAGGRCTHPPAQEPEAERAWLPPLSCFIQWDSSHGVGPPWVTSPQLSLCEKHPQQTYSCLYLLPDSKSHQVGNKDQPSQPQETNFRELK